MAATDFVTESQMSALVTELIAQIGSTIVVIDIGAAAGTARTAGTNQIQYWICDNGVTPSNAVEGDLVYNRSA